MITETDSNKEPTNKLEINSCTFVNNSNINGGAISLMNVGYVQITNGTKFSGNTARINGGALYFYCNKYGLDLSKCSLNITNTSFSSNLAGSYGGALNWDINEPTMKNVTMVKNQAGIYGDQIASVAKFLVQIPQSELNNTVLNSSAYPQSRRLLQAGNQSSNSSSTIGSISNAQSGGAINLYFVLIDKYGSVYKADNSSKLDVK